MRAINRGFMNLFRFGGRDSPGQFWPYAAVVFVIGFVVMGFGVAMAMEPLFEQALLAAQQNPDSVHVTQSPTHYSVQIEPGAGFAPDFSNFFLALGAGAALLISLLAAAVTRRLHDRGLSGFIGLVPVVFLVTGLIGMQRLMGALDSPDFNERLFILIFLNNLIYMASLAGLVILLILPGQPRRNAHGDPAGPPGPPVVD